jgi:hypothetical protein
MSGFDSDIVERARAVSLLAVTAKHGLTKLAKRRREYIGACPRCGGCSRFNVNADKGVFLCRGCQAGGSGAVDLEIFLTGCSFTQAIEALTGERMPSADEARAAAAQRRVQEKATQAGQVGTARWLWEQRQAPQGTIVERYLAARGYTGIIPATIAYLPARGDYAPAMISAYARPVELDNELRAPHGDEVCAVHLTRLLPDGSDRRRDAHAKITIGAPIGYPIAIAPVTDGMSLALCEGIEDALAFRAAGFGAWAAGSSSYIGDELAAHIPPLDTLLVERHPDEASYTAIAKLRALLATWWYPPEVIIREASS